MCEEEEGSSCAVGNEYAMQLGVPVNFDWPDFFGMHIMLHPLCTAIKTSAGEFSMMLLLSYILDCCVSHIYIYIVIMIAKITFLIQSSSHLLPTVNKLVSNPTRQNNMAECSYCRSTDSLVQWALIDLRRTLRFLLIRCCAAPNASIKQSVVPWYETDNIYSHIG